MKIKTIATVLCIATIGLAVSCTKEEKENATIVGKWKSIYSLVESYNYRMVGQNMKIDTSIYYDDSKTGKAWEFTQDGFFLREGSQRMKYYVNGDYVTFAWPEEPDTIVGSIKIMELHEKWVQLFSTTDNRGNNGQGTYTKETYVLSRPLDM